MADVEITSATPTKQSRVIAEPAKFSRNATGLTQTLDAGDLFDMVDAIDHEEDVRDFTESSLSLVKHADAITGLVEEQGRQLTRCTSAPDGAAAGRAAGAGGAPPSEEPPATLRENVTSPGGTTLEALKILMADDGLAPLMTRAIAAATERSRELAG